MNVTSMNIILTPEAILRIKELGKNECSVLVKRGGCYGYKTTFEFSSKGDLFKTQSGINIHLDAEVDVDLIVDYTISLLQSSFIVKSLNTNNCCCNKSIRIPGIKVDKTQCVS